MPRGPKGQKRPRDPNQLAKLIANIATGQVEDHETAPEVKREKRVRSAKAPHDLRGNALPKNIRDIHNFAPCVLRKRGLQGGEFQNDPLPSIDVYQSLGIKFTDGIEVAKEQVQTAA